MAGSDMTDVSQMPLPGGGQNTPESGTYGAKSQLDALKGAIGLPPPSQGQDAAKPVPSMPASAKPSQPGGPFGLPGAITAPTQSPNVPANTPLAQPVNPVANAANPSQQRLALLDMLSKNPDVSDQTRELAQIMLQKLIAASKSS